MNVANLIGRVVVVHLRNELSADRGASADGTARYIIDSLSAEHTAAIARCVLDDPVLSQQIELELPAHLLAGKGLPPDILTTTPATYYRNPRWTPQTRP